MTRAPSFMVSLSNHERSYFDKLSVNGMYSDKTDIFPFVLIPSKHNTGFAGQAEAEPS